MIESSLILIVDDDQTMRILLQQAMLLEQFSVQLASDGQECLDFCQQSRPDLILLDAVMPVLDGFQCCAMLYHLFEENCPPILMITTLDDEQSVEDAFVAGAIDYITKPIHWSVLKYRVRRLLESSWSMTEVKRLVRQLEAANQELHRLNRLDGLTHIANRRHFDEVFQQEWHRAATHSYPLTLILCDIDFFKQYNDLYGHVSGDACLIAVAEVISSAANQPTSLVARYGGEEFAILLPSANYRDALNIAIRIQSTLKAKAIPHSASSTGQVTVCCGLTSFIPTVQIAPEVLIEKADKALYQAKALGRNQIATH